MAAAVIGQHIPGRSGEALLAWILNPESRELAKAEIWAPIFDALFTLGQLDQAYEIAQSLSISEADTNFFSLVAADLEHLTGRSEIAIDRLRLLAGASKNEPDIARMIFEIDPTGANIDQFEAVLKLDHHWRGNSHGLFVRKLIDQNLMERAASFFHQWIAAHQITPDALESIGETCLLLGEFALARQAFRFGHDWLNENADKLVGRFDSAVLPYSASVDEAIISYIKVAFDKAPNPPVGFDNFSGVADLKIRVLFISTESSEIENDLAAILSGSARSAGVEIDCFLDNALTAPFDFRGTDANIEAHIQMLRTRISDFRPDIVILDVWRPMYRGNIYEAYSKLKMEFGFRLVALFRDSGAALSIAIEIWLENCDTLLAFNDTPTARSQFDHAKASKLLTLPVPAMFGPFLNRPKKDIGLLFVGAINFKPRLYLLAELLNEPLPFWAVFGHKRKQLAPDVHSYANLLGRAMGILNVSRHGYDVHLITGRVWETVAAGTCLVEQDNPETARALTPYRHFLPWRSVNDIAQVAHFIQRHPEIVDLIGREAHDWVGQHFGNRQFWRTLAAHALRPLPSALKREDVGGPAHRHPLWIDPVIHNRVTAILQISKD
jgi:tetratricopeptide (TPR) repeat protein